MRRRRDRVGEDNTLTIRTQVNLGMNDRAAGRRITVAESCTGGLVSAATLVALNVGASYMTSHSKTMSDLLDGSPVLLGRDGKIFDKVLKQCRLSKTEVDEALHEADCKLEEMGYVFLEADGNITIQKKR